MKKLKIILIVFISVFITDCQKDEITSDDTPQILSNIVIGSPLFELISRTSQNSTKIDNVLDNCSGFSVQLPVNVTVNGVAINVITTSDYVLVKNAKDQYTTDNDIVYFNYPITVIYKNFTSQNVSNYTQFSSLVQSCGSDNGLNEIDCISFNFPITINIYDVNNQIADSVSIQNKKQLYSFIYGLTSNDIAAIAYPISMTNSNGQNVVLNTNEELEIFINGSINACNISTGGTGNLNLQTVLTSGSWYISYYFDDTIDETYVYNGYNFTFLSNGNTLAVKNAVTTNGTWEIEYENSIKKLDLNFEGDFFSEIEENWKVIEFTETIIRLKKSENSEIEYLYFTKN